MPKITFSEADLKSMINMEPGWYKVKMKECDEKTSKAGDSTNYNCVFTVIEPGPLEGIEVSHSFNDKAEIGRKQIMYFFKCFMNGQPIESKKAYEWNDAVGLPVMAYCFYDSTWKRNDIKEFKPVE